MDWEPVEGFELIAQGAEARLYKGMYLGKPTLLKERFVKRYRHPDLDSHLTKERIKAEGRAIVRAKSAGIATPSIFLIDLSRRSIYMEYIENATVLRNFIKESISKNSDLERLISFIGRGLGSLIAKLHSENILHGDLTTSNILLRDISDDMYTTSETLNHFVLIDFGLARLDSTVEDKAVDLYVLERSVGSAHPEVPSLFPCIFEKYQKSYTNQKQCKAIVNKYKEVQMRGRKRLMVG